MVLIYGSCLFFNLCCVFEVYFVERKTKTTKMRTKVSNKINTQGIIDKFLFFVTYFGFIRELRVFSIIKVKQLGAGGIFHRLQYYKFGEKESD